MNLSGFTVCNEPSGNPRKTPGAGAQDGSQVLWGDFALDFGQCFYVTCAFLILKRSGTPSQTKKLLPSDHSLSDLMLRTLIRSLFPPGCPNEFPPFHPRHGTWRPRRPDYPFFHVCVTLSLRSRCRYSFQVTLLYSQIYISHDRTNKSASSLSRSLSFRSFPYKHLNWSYHHFVLYTPTSTVRSDQHHICSYPRRLFCY